jgi:Asp-tRNA(Asn)/Glu-tRNA(Gln) amidotransferase A subunit family amidase
LGWAALSLPSGSDGRDRPIGVQLAAPPANVGALVRVAALLSE